MKSIEGNDFKTLKNTKKIGCSVTRSCPTLCSPMDCSPPGSSLQRIFRGRILEQVAISFSTGSSQPRDPNHVCCVSCIMSPGKPKKIKECEIIFVKGTN